MKTAVKGDYPGRILAAVLNGKKSLIQIAEGLIISIVLIPSRLSD